MRANDVIVTSGWSESYETHYTGGYGEYTEGYIGDAHITVSYCHSPGVESWYNGNWTKSSSLDIDKAKSLLNQNIKVLQIPLKFEEDLIEMNENEAKEFRNELEIENNIDIFYESIFSEFMFS